MPTDESKSERAPVAASVCLEPVEAGDDAEGDGFGESYVISDRIRDLSSAGVFLGTPVELPVGTEVRFEVYDESGETAAEGLARVVWVVPKTGLGLEFIEIESGALALDSMVTSQEAREESPEAATVATHLPGRDAVQQDVTIGIDLGTSNTCASAVLGGRPQVIPTRYGTNTIPSVVTMDETGRLLVGQAAAKRMILQPHRTVYGSKRLIGRTYRDSIAEEYQPHFAYPIIEVKGQRFGADLDGIEISMQDVAQAVLAEVKTVAERHLGTKVTRAVITVPAYFNDVQRMAVRNAARAAQLEVARIVNEPTAAAVAYGYDREEQARLAIFDLGGGTFDVSILEVSGNRFEVIATGGDNFLGGIDFDDLIASHLLEEFQRVEGVTFEPTPQQITRLREAAEETKHGLTQQQRVEVNLPQFAEVGGALRDLVATVERDTVEALSADLVERMIDIAGRTLADAELDVDDVDEVLLVGGMTRMPLVQEKVEAFFGRRPSRRVNPDEAVALGAALLADEDSAGRKVTLVDVLPLSIGVAGEGRSFQRWIKRNTLVPSEVVREVTTSRDGAREIAIPLFQGERRDAAANEYLGTIVVENVPEGPAGSQRYSLTLSLDEQCLLKVRAREFRTGAEVPVRLDRARSVEQVIRGLGRYEGPAPKRAPEKPKTVLGRLFKRIKRIWK